MVLPKTPTKRRRRSLEPDKRTTVNTDILKWVLTPQSIAPCFVRDVFSMKHNAVKDEDYYWIGRVPCRSVKLVGILVGAQPSEKRVTYSLDDGTGVIECVHRQIPAAPPKGAKELAPWAKPIARSGASVKVIGRVFTHFDTKRITVDSIECCASYNEEPLHWRAVRELHNTTYSSTEHFVVPTPLSPLLPPPRDIPRTPVPASSAIYVSASSASAPADHPTPSSRATTVSPAKSTISQSSAMVSPLRLRHPSRLHTKDLTDNNFRIYLKHFMDYVQANEDEDEDLEVPATPTKRQIVVDLTTPKRSTTRVDTDETPRPSRPPDHTDEEQAVKGFTLSFLRRVPELSIMAKRVVEAEAKRRKRKETENGKETKTKKSRPSMEPIQSKMKRLFVHTIVQLVNEGSVVIWNGSKRSDIPDYGFGMGGPWKYKAGDMSMITNLSASFASTAPVDDAEVSDEDPEEEAYVSLTANLLAIEVERVMRRFSRNRSMSKEDLLGYLRRDDRWRKVGEWDVRDALQVLLVEGKVAKASGGRWEMRLRG